MPTALVTGANRGIGLEFVKQYAADGWKVIATCRNPINVGELGQVPGDIAVYSLDVDDPVSLSRLVSDLKDKAIDLLINNAGIHGPRGVTVDKIDLNDWMAVMRTNAMSPLFVARALRQNIAKSEMKTIANISSQMGSITNWAGGSEYIYKSSKAALNMTMACFADEVAADGIKVVIYHPGWVRTDMGGPSATLSPTQSVVSMRASIASLTMADSGTFLNYDGASMPW